MPRKTVLCPECNERVKGGKFVRHMKENHTEEKFVCNLCGNKFKRPENLKTHKKHSCKKDLNLFPFNCLCGETFKTEIKMKNHQKDSRYCVKRTTCEKCKLKMFTIKDLKDHIVTCHTEAEDNVDQGEGDGDEGEAIEDLEDNLEVEAELEDPPPGNSENPVSALAFDNLILGDTGLDDLALDDLDYDEVVRNVGNFSF